MRSLLISGVALFAVMATVPAMAADSPAATIVGTGQYGAHAGARVMGRTNTTIVNRWGGRIGGRWIGGVRAPGGWAAYRRPVVGWVMPRYWIDGGYTLGDYRVYGLPAPAPGYSWSRYYDDAVLVDGSGRVYDSRTGIDWDDYEGGYSDGHYAAPPLSVPAPPPPPAFADNGRPGGPPPPPPGGRGNEGRGNDGAVTGAVVGGVAGGVLGNVVAGHGNRTAGTIVGAGVGALAGAAIGGAGDRREMRRDAPPPPPTAPHPAYAPPPAYTPPPVDMRTVDDDRDTMRGARRRDVRDDGYYRDYGPTWMADDAPSLMASRPMAPPIPPHMARPMPPVGPMAQGPMRPPMPPPMPMRHGGHVHGAAPGQPDVTTYTTPGYAAAGYWYPGTTVTMITFPPPVTTVTTTETVTYSTRRLATKRIPARRKARCGC